MIRHKTTHSPSFSPFSATTIIHHSNPFSLHSTITKHFQALHEHQNTTISLCFLHKNSPILNSLHNKPIFVVKQRRIARASPQNSRIHQGQEKKVWSLAREVLLLIFKQKLDLLRQVAESFLIQVRVTFSWSQKLQIIRLLVNLPLHVFDNI